MSWFKFNGISSDELGLIITRTPLRPTWEEETEDISIPGRRAKIKRYTGLYDDKELNISAVISDTAKIAEIYKTLRGEGELILSTSPNEVLKCHVAMLIPDAVALTMAELPITFICEPFARPTSSTVVEFIDTYTPVNNPGTIYSEPVITLKIPPGETPVLLGDVNFDGKVNAMDASLVLTEYTNIQTGGEPTFTAEQNLAADMNNDGAITSIDAAQILDVYSSGQGTQNTEKPSQNIIINTNGAELIVGVPDAVVANGFTVTIDCENKLIYYTNGDETKVNILQYNSFDLPSLHIGTGLF